MGDGEGQVASGQNDALIKGKVARQRRRLGASTAATPGQTPSVNVVGVVSSDGKHEEGVENEGEEEEERKGRGFLSWWEGQLGKVVAISFLGKSPDSCTVNARPPSFRQNRRDDKGQGRCVLKLASLSSPRDRGEVEAETSGKFCENFGNSGKKNKGRW